MTPGQAAFCALLFGAGAGSVSTIAVQKAAKPAAIERSVKARKASPAKSTETASSRICIDQPLTVGRLPDLQIIDLEPIEPVELAPFDGAAFARLASPPPGPGLFPVTRRPDPVHPPGAVPEPVAWASMVTGFGVIGIAARKRRKKRWLQPF